MIVGALLLEQVPPRGQEVCFENGLKASVKWAAWLGRMVFLAAVIPGKAGMCFWCFAVLFSLWQWLAVHTALLVTHPFIPGMLE